MKRLFRAMGWAGLVIVALFLLIVACAVVLIVAPFFGLALVLSAARGRLVFEYTARERAG